MVAQQWRQAIASRHGAVLSLASEERTPSSDRVREVITANLPPAHGPWRELQEKLEQQLDPHDILNPY